MPFPRDNPRTGASARMVRRFLFSAPVRSVGTGTARRSDADRFRATIPLIGVVGLLLLATAGVGCRKEGEGGSREFISVGTAPVGGAFYTVGSAVCEVVNNNQRDRNWRVSAESTGGSMENIRLLSQGRMQFAMSNSSITYFAVRGEGDWEQQHATRAVMTLFPNVAMFVTMADSGIARVTDLKGKRVFLGPEGAGFEYFVGPILQAHGLSLNDLELRYGSQQNAVDLLGDGVVDAAMIGGGVPNPALLQLAMANSIRLIPYEESAMQQLVDAYPFFEPATIPGGTYKGIAEDYHGLNVGSAHLITHADVDEQLVYDFARLVYENREQIVQRHQSAKDITPENVARDTGTEFHPGAIRYFREVGLWPEVQSDE